MYLRNESGRSSCRIRSSGSFEYESLISIPESVISVTIAGTTSVQYAPQDIRNNAEPVLRGSVQQHVNLADHDWKRLFLLIVLLRPQDMHIVGP